MKACTKLSEPEESRRNIKRTLKNWTLSGEGIRNLLKQGEISIKDILECGNPYNIFMLGRAISPKIFNQIISQKMKTKEELLKELSFSTKLLKNLLKKKLLTIEDIIEYGNTHNLEILYRELKLSPKQIDKAMEKGEKLWVLYRFQKLSEEQIMKAIDKGIALWVLYQYKKLSPKLIKKAVEKGKALDILYKYQKVKKVEIKSEGITSKFSELLKGKDKKSTKTT